jgi:hypothetical protein
MLRLFMMLSLFLFTSSAANAGEQPEATLYKRPFCGCCDGHADHLRANGYKVTIVQTKNLSLIKKKHGVPQEFEGCHTIEIGGYVVEGHVPASIIGKLLKERPAIRGISLPGMPEGSPGMSGVKSAPFEIHQFTADGQSKIYAVE